MTDNTLIASLPWYDLESTQASLDQLWSDIHTMLTHEVDLPLPDQLERSMAVTEQWRSPGLILSQCCGPDLLTEFGQDLQVIGRPVFNLDCPEGAYFSHVVSRPGARIGDSVRVVLNGETSWSGHHALRRWLLAEGIEVSASFVSGARG